MVDMNKSNTIEKKYQKKTPLEHILIRPDSYVGSIKNEEKVMWVYNADADCMTEKSVNYNPALYKIFDEILVNASDNKMADKSMTCIRIQINQAKNEIRIWNNGRGIPVTMHKDEKMYVPTMIFGHLLTSTNFDDTEKKVTGGRNGYGAKLCNIFSTEFTVETSSKKFNKSFKQTWSNNMSNASDPIIGPVTAADFTSVTFSPDLSKFGMECLDDDIVALFSRRAYDIAACTNGVTVFLNGRLIPVNNFKDYVDLYIKNMSDFSDEPLKVVYEKYGDRWEVAVTTSVNDSFNQISFVNSIATTKGGSHVNYITDQLATKLLEIAKKKLKTDKQGAKLKAAQVKMNLWVFVKCLVENPTFDSQTKENMTLQAKDFGSTCILSDKLIAAAAKNGIMDKMTMWANMKNQALMDKKCSKNKQSKLKNIPKLDDANKAGSRESLQCTLILTEGDSAKTLAVSGLSVVGRDYYGVFPLRGKLLNVREATAKQLIENAEISNLIKILGLRYQEKYLTPETMKTLRYGKIMIMTDQDQDGSHIKGLLINFIHNHWPNLLKYSFIEQFITPIVKATKKNESLSFYSLPELFEWMKNTPDHNRYNLKYYKGLGTSTSKEAKEYFSDMLRHLIKFKYQGTVDDKSILLAFGKNKADERKEWLTTFMERSKRRRELGQVEDFLYGPGTRVITFDDFVNKELILFSNTDNARSIPSLVDGLKPGQRKVMFTCFKRNLVKELKVAQLAGSVAELSCYHHGEASLMGTIINLAQDFVGSNNINLLMPGGQFGTRLTGGKDSASPRYIFTQLNRITRLIFHPSDDPIYKYEFEDNQRIEPEWYCPIIPMILVNGADGIGTGWSSKVHNYNPREIIANIRHKLAGEPLVKMHPWYRGFRGSITETADNRYIVSGEVALMNNNSLEITELPVRSWTQKYKEDVLEPYLNGSDKIPTQITDYKEHNTDITVRFVVEMSAQKFSEAEEKGFHKFLKLQTPMTCNNMVLFDECGVITRYARVEDIMETFYRVRLDMYGKRKNYMEGLLSAEASRLENQARFIEEKIANTITIENKKIKDIVEMLKSHGYNSDPLKAWKKSMEKLESLAREEDEQIEGSDEDVDENQPDYSYLTSMQILSLSMEKKNTLLAERDKKLAELAAMKKKTLEQLWLDDLNALEKCLNEMDSDKSAESAVGGSAAATIESSTAKKSGKRGGRKVVKVVAETAPSKFAQRVEPHIDDEVAQRLATEAQKRKQRQLMEDHFQADGEPVSKKPRKSPAAPIDVGDDDDEPMSLANRMAASGVNTTELTATKSVPRKGVAGAMRNSGGSKPKKTKKSWDDDDDDADLDDIDDDVIRSAGDDNSREHIVRRNAAKNVKYNLDDNDDDEEKANLDKSPTIAISSASDDSEFDPAPLMAAASKPISPVKNNAFTIINSTAVTKKDAKKSARAPTKNKPLKPKTTEPKGKKTKTNEPKPVKADKKPSTKKPVQKKLFESDEEDAGDIFKPDGKGRDKVELGDDEEELAEEKPLRTRVKPVAKKYSDNIYSDDDDESINNDDDSDFDVGEELRKSKPKKKAHLLEDSD